MVVIFNQSSLLDGAPVLLAAPTAPANGGTTTPTPELPDGSGETVTLLPVPRGSYRKTRHTGNLSATPSARARQPAQEVVSGPAIDFSVSDANAFYRWVGFFTLDNTEYDFIISATNQFRVKLDGATIIDDFRSGFKRTVIERVRVTGGSRLLTIEWGAAPSLLGSALSSAGEIEFSLARIAQDRWTSCQDGQERAGAPPQGWVLTPAGCWKPPVSGETQAVNLLDVLQVTPGPTQRVERAYVQGSGTALAPQRFTFFNRSTNMEVHVSLSGPRPVRFVTAFQFAGDVGVGGLPANSFTLAPNAGRDVDVVFLASEMDALPEGLLRSDILVAVRAGTVTLPKDSDGDIDVGAPIELGDVLPPPPGGFPTVPETPPASPTWRDCSSGTEVVRDGFPPSSFVLRDDGCYVPAPAPTPQLTLSVTAAELTPSFTSGRSNARASLAAILQGADPTTFSYSWNFDVLKQGAGTGTTTNRSTTATWRMVEADLIRLQDPTIARTTRTVEVIAIRGSTVLRARRQVTLDDPALAVISQPLQPFKPAPGSTDTELRPGGDLLA